MRPGDVLPGALSLSCCMGTGVFLSDQADNSGGEQDADENTAAVQEDILDGTASCRNHELMDFIRDGVYSANEKTVKQEMLFPAEPAFEADPDKESQNGENENMGKLPDKALGKEDERCVILFIGFPDGIEQVEFKETGIIQGISDRETEAFRLFLLLGGKEKDCDHDDQHKGCTGITDPGFPERVGTLGNGCIYCHGLITFLNLLAASSAAGFFSSQMAIP